MTIDPTRLARRGAILIWLWLASDIALALASLWQIKVLGGFGGAVADDDTIRTSDYIGGITGLLLVVFFVAAAVGVLRWLYVVNRNAHQWSEGMTVSPGWSVGRFFVPITNLWKPFEGVRETWAATLAPDDIGSVPVPGWMRLWWGLWLATNILGQITFRATMAAEDIPSLIAANWLYVLSLGIDVPLAFLLVRLMTELSSHQRLRLS